MRKNRKLLFWVLCPIAITIGFIGYGWYWAFYDIHRITGGEVIAQSTSPQGTYTVKVYLHNGGATTALAARGQLIFHRSSHKPRNIYWQNREERANISWIDDDTVNIGHVLELPNEVYDYRRH